MTNCANGCAAGCTGCPRDNLANPADPAPRRYPNVKPSKFRRNRWEAVHPVRPKKFLGTFDTPEAARYAVLIAQAEHLEAKAARYRAEAEKL